MEHFYGDSLMDSRERITIERLAGSKSQNRTDTFAAGRKRISDGIIESCRRGGEVEPFYRTVYNSKIIIVSLHISLFIISFTED